MNTAKKNSGEDPQTPFKQNSFRFYYTHKYWKNHYQNIPATKYAILRASNLQNVMQNIESHVLPPLYFTLALPPPSPLQSPFFCFFKNLLRLKINILSSVYPEINFLAEPVMKIRGYYVSVLQKLTGYRRIPCQEWVSPRGVSRAVKRTFLTGDSPIPCQFL